MTLFENERTIDVQRLAFRYSGRRYLGKGFLDWSPGTGFHLKAFVDRQGPPHENLPVDSDTRFLGPNETPICKLQVSNAKWACMRLALSSPFQVAFGRLDYRPSWVLFAHSRRHYEKVFTGSARFAIVSKPLLPNVLATETKLEGELISTESHRGFRHSANGFELALWRGGDNILECFWECPDSPDSKRRAWEYAYGLRLALALMLGESLPFMSRITYRQSRRYEQVFAPSESHTFRYVWPLANRNFDPTLMLHLANALSGNNLAARISDHVLGSMIAATTQNNWSSRCLTISTILEGILRTALGIPYVPGDHFDSRNALNRFREMYLNDSWIQTCNETYATWQRIRHKYAHPDWIPSEEDPGSIREMTVDLADVRSLTSFYAVMIQALTNYPVPDPAN